jgi:hypothetical protein
MAATIGNLFINLRANSKPMTKGLKSAQGAVARFRGRIKKTFSALTSMKSLLIGIGVAAVVALGKRLAESIDKAGKAAKRLGMTTEELIAMRHAAELSGVTVETFDMAMQRMVRRVSEASHGFGEAKGALEELGLDAKALTKIPVSEAMVEVTRAMGGAETQADRVRLAMKLFDSEGVALVNMMADGEEGLRAMMNEAHDLGLTLQGPGVQSVESMNDAFQTFGKVITAAAQHVLVILAPAITKLTRMVVDWAKEQGGAGVIAVNAFMGIAKAVAFVLDIVHALVNGLKFIATTVRWLASQWMYYWTTIMGEALVTVIELLDDDWGKAARKAQQDIKAIALEMERAAESDFNELMDDALGDSWGDSVMDFANALVEEMKAANNTEVAVKSLGDAHAGMSKELEAATMDAQKFIDELDKQIRTFGMSKDAIQIDDFIRAGVDPKLIAQLKQRTALLGRMEAAAKAAGEPLAAKGAAKSEVDRAVAGASVETAIGAAKFAFGFTKNVEEEQLEEAEEQTDALKQLLVIGRQQYDLVKDTFGGLLQ